MVNQKIASLIAEQVNKELESAYLYAGMEQYLANNYNFSGFEHFFKQQVKEEIEHAYEMMDFLHSVDQKVSLKALPEPKADYNDFVDVFEKAYEHEKFISKSIIDILEQAVAEKDFVSETLLREFVKEQIEEEDTFRKHVEALNFIKDDKNAVMDYNLHLGQR